MTIQSDTSPEAEKIMIELIRSFPVWKRLERVVALNEACRQLALADIKRNHPYATEDEIRRLLAERLLPPELVEKVYGPKSRDATLK